MSIRANLTAALALIEDPKHWIQGEYAKNADGEPVMARAPDATCFCSVGAVCRATGRSVFNIDNESEHLRRTAKTLFGPTLNILVVNDELGHEAVVNMFRHAIETAPN